MAALGRPQEMNSLFDTISSRVTPEVVQKLAQRAGINAGEARRALDAIISSHVDGLVTMGASSSGRMLDVVRQHSGTESFAHILAAGEALQSQATTGRTLQAAVYGDDLGRRTRCIASSVGISESAATSMMEMVIPTVVGVLARDVQDRHLDAAGLGQRLREERGTVRRAMPAGLAECLDGPARREASTYREPAGVVAQPGPVEAPASTGLSPWLWLLPALALLGLGLWYFNRPATTSGLAGTRWQWQRTVLGDGTERRPVNPGAYVVDFQQDGAVAVHSDCNAMKGTYTTDGGRLALGSLAGATAACPGQSLSEDFTGQLRSAGSFSATDSRLTVGLQNNGGTMEFVPVR